MFSVIGLMLPEFLRPLDIASRLWLQHFSYWLSGIMAVLLMLLLILMCILQFSKKEPKRFVISAITLAILPVSYGIGAYSVMMWGERLSKGMEC